MNTLAGLRRAGLLLALWATAESGAAPEPSAQARVGLLVIGDWGFSAPEKRTPDQQNTARAMAAFARRSPGAFDAVLVPGDNFKVKLAGPEDPQFRQAFEEMYDAQVLRLPFFAVLGSHDYEYHAAEAQLAYGRQHPDSRWRMAGRWYRVDLPTAAPLVTVLMLDSDRTAIGKDAWQAQIRWMEGELSKPRTSAWTICVGHHPLFSDGQHGDNKAMQSAWGPILKKHRVDFYISGHDHVLQHLQEPDWPTTFLISGGGGENTHRPVSGRHGPFVRATHGFAALRFDMRSARVTLVADTGVVLHAFERDRSGEIRLLGMTPVGATRAPAKNGATP